VLSGPFEVLRGQIGLLGFQGGSVDLGDVQCAAWNLGVDRVTENSATPDPAGCDPAVVYYLARPSGAADWGAAGTGGEPRDVMSPDPACP
jgi:hypothetical protein